MLFIYTHAINPGPESGTTHVRLKVLMPKVEQDLATGSGGFDQPMVIGHKMKVSYGGGTLKRMVHNGKSI